MIWANRGETDESEGEGGRGTGGGVLPQVESDGVLAVRVGADGGFRSGKRRGRAGGVRGAGGMEPVGIWPELVKLLSKAGISDYSIFLDKETLTLFAVQKLNDDNTADTLANKAIMRKWWDYMADIMECNPDNSPVVCELTEVFHMD